MELKIGSVFEAKNGNYMVYDKLLKTKSGQEPLFNCYSVFNSSLKTFDFYPVLLTEASMGKQVGSFEITFHGQIPHYTKQFIDLFPEYFI